MLERTDFLSQHICDEEKRMLNERKFKKRKYNFFLKSKIKMVTTYPQKQTVRTEIYSKKIYQ